MIRFRKARRTFCRALFAFAAVFLTATGGMGQEFRALWVDAFHDGFMTASEVTKLVADARAGNFNAIIPEVRKRGDVYYNSLYEPKATDVSPQSFDPLADLCAKAHNTNSGARIEVHAWIVTFPVWNSPTSLPPQLNHPFRLHPDWLSKTESGTNYVSGVNYQLDPGHPGVQQHIFNLAMEIISNYDVDGLNFDYIRYDGRQWGYNDLAVSRFNTRFGRVGQPAQSDSSWLQWRRDQVSALLRKVYLHSAALKPHVKISADTICFAPGPASPADWTSSAAYTSVLQDWRAWMEEGILDLNIPMAYFDQRRWATAWSNWSAFAKDHRYGRHVAIGPGIYLNTLSNVLFQMRHTRLPSPAGNSADGVSGYSYAVPVTNDTPASTFFLSLVQTNAYETNSVAIFSAPAAPPVMPWKTAPTRGHLKGFAFNGTNGNGFDAATITIAGPTNRTLITDATGFYGAVDLPVGNYTVQATNAGFQARLTNFTVSPGVVATHDLTLPLLVPTVPSSISNVLATVGARDAIITWRTANAAGSQIQYGLTTNYGFMTPEDPVPVTSHAVLLSGLAQGTNYFFGVISRSGTNVARSDGWGFSTAGELILDNTEATFSGSWNTGASSTDKYGVDYRYLLVNASGSTASALFTPNIATRGSYDVFIWYPAGSNRPTNASVTVYFSGGSVNTVVNQTLNGGSWRQVGTNLNFSSGANGFVRISNFSSDTGKVVMADAVRLVYRAGQDAPADPTMPDWWAFHYFGANTNAQADSDGDGYPNWAEYLVGTVPTNGASRLSFSLASLGSGGLRASFAPVPLRRTYQLQERLEPTGWLTHTQLQVIAGTNGHGWFSISNGLEPARMLRLKVEWAP